VVRVVFYRDHSMDRALKTKDSEKTWWIYEVVYLPQDFCRHLKHGIPCAIILIT